MSLPTLALLVFIAALNANELADPACANDADRDGQSDCLDPDDDNDGLSDVEEAILGTNSLETDSDRDGLPDLLERSAMWPHAESAPWTGEVRRSDPTVPTLLVEVDFLVGFRPSAAVLTLTRRSFEALGLEVIFWVDEPSSTVPSSPLVDIVEMEQLLLTMDSASEHELLRYYVHVVFAEYGEGGDHGKTHFAEPNDPARGNHGNRPDPRYSGSLVWTQTVIDDFSASRASFEAIGVSQDMLIARSFVHEIGHLLGCAHEGSNNGGIDYSNVMIRNSRLGNPADAALHWEAQFEAGHPAFSQDTWEQMDLSFKASVEIGSSPILRRFDFGPSGGPIAPGYFEVTEGTAFDASLTFGFTPPLPTVGSSSGSDPSDSGHVDFVRGDPAETASTQFRVTNLGRQPVDLHFSLGATLDEAISVRCEVVHPGRVTSFRHGPIGPDGGSQETLPDLVVFPRVQGSALRFAPTEVTLECLDLPGLWDDAPIELLVVRKRET